MTQTIDIHELRSRVSSLESKLLERDPNIRTLLHDIWITARQYPENVALLTESEMATIFKGLETMTNIHIVDSVSASAKKATAPKKKNLTDADFGV